MPELELSGREIDVLRRLAAGERDQDISEGIDLSERQVKTIVNTLNHKLGATNRSSLVAQAMRARVIS